MTSVLTAAILNYPRRGINSTSRGGRLLDSSVFFPRPNQRNVRYVHPLFWPVVNFASRIAAGLTGRHVRNKLRKLPKEERKRMTSSLLKGLGIPFGVIMVGYTGVITYKHRDRTMFTGRNRTISIPPYQMMDLTDKLERSLLQEATGRIFSGNSPMHKGIEAIAAKVLSANVDIKEVQNIDWRLSVIHSNDSNAFVLPNGHIFVHTGILSEFVQNEHQLAFILAHEIAHVLLKHSAEKASKLQLKGFVDVIVTFLLFIGLADWTAFLSSVLFPKFTSLAFEQPYSRLMENEADEVGLMLIAKACYDIREACALWKLVALKMQVEKFGGGKEKLDFLSTHPTFENRAQNIEALTRRATDIRMGRHCQPLKGPDPVESVETLRRKVKQMGPIAPGSKIEILKDEVPGRKRIRVLKNRWEM